MGQVWGGGGADAADPAGEEEEEGGEEDDGEEDDGVEEGAAANLEVTVVEFGVVPVESLRVLGGHSGVCLFLAGI